MGEVVARRAFSVNYRQLDRWSVAFFRSVNWQWPKECIKPIGVALQRVQKIVTTDLVATPIIEKISFGGVLTILDEEKRIGYKGRLFKAEAGQLIYSKIRVKQGSVCIVPFSIDWVAVSSEYPVYEINPNVANPKYLELVLQSSAFKHYLDGLSHGGSTKTRINPNQFENLLIPIPPLPIQQKIVGHWEAAQTAIESTNKSIEKIEQSLEVGLLCKLGIRVPSVAPQTRPFSVRFSQNERWDTFFFRKDFVSLENQIASTAHIKLGDALHFISRSWKEKDFESGEFDYIEISSVNKVNGITSTRRVKVHEAPSRATTLVKEGDVIISTTRPYLGAFAIVEKKHDGNVCSSGFVLADSVKTDEITKEFVLFFLKSIAGLKQVERRMSGGLYPAIVQSELEKVLVPLPSLEMQLNVVNEYRSGIAEIKRLHLESDREKNKALSLVEKMILGTRPVEAH